MKVKTKKNKSMSKTVYNFSAGPAVLPDEVVDTIKSEISDFDQGMSVMEVSHRSSAFKTYAENSEDNLRSLLNINSDYSVLFLQGGATYQFSMIPQNLSINNKADYLVTGAWTAKAANYAKYHTKANIVSNSVDNNYTTVSDISHWKLTDDADYFYYSSNETIHGLEIHEVPNINTPIVNDMSSTICSRPIDINKYGLIFAGAQKNLGIAGLTVVIVRNDLIKDKGKDLPPLLRYQCHSDAKSMLNTSPVFAWYVAGLVFKWILDKGGVSAMGKANQKKAKLLYEYIDKSNLYSNPVAKKYRSWMNIPFILSDAALDERFLNEANKEGLLNLKGHRTVGGMRASVYNAMPIEGVKKLIDFMDYFQSKN
jgi:phosphoserine aminotransferase